MEHMQISTSVVSASFDNFKKYCAHFGCKVKKTKAFYFITSEDAANFFWLGMNMNFHSESRLCKTPADKYLKNSSIKNKV